MVDTVVLLDANGAPIGEADRESVHGASTPLHLAFSCYLFDAEGRVLLTRRALGKRSWPGVWTNAGCGHPRPGEDPAEAVRRRIAEELGVAIAGLSLALPDFRYRARDASGIEEHELCPVYLGLVDGALAPDPAEVAEHAWAGSWTALVAAVEAAPFAFSPWLQLQVPLLDAAAAPARLLAGAR